MLSKNKLKAIQQLHTKKGREEQGLFIAEGTKLVNELIENKITVVEVYKVQSSNFELQNTSSAILLEVSEAELKKISTLVRPNEVVAIVKIPKVDLVSNTLLEKLSLVLDGIQDPGNLGTIIRVADWFGIENIICSLNTVDCYNPKVVQATMGSIARVKIFYKNIEDWIAQLSISDSRFPIYGAVLDGKNIYSHNLGDKGLVVIGNEGKGISNTIQQLLTDRISIPNYSFLKQGGGEVESLNAAIATAVICAEFRRK